MEGVAVEDAAVEGVAVEDAAVEDAAVEDAAVEDAAVESMRALATEAVGSAPPPPPPLIELSVIEQVKAEFLASAPYRRYRKTPAPRGGVRTQPTSARRQQLREMERERKVYKYSADSPRVPSPDTPLASLYTSADISADSSFFFWTPGVGGGDLKGRVGSNARSGCRAQGGEEADDATGALPLVPAGLERQAQAARPAREGI